MRTYDSFIGGRDVAGAAWVYTLTARSLLDDVFASVSLKRELEQDPESDRRAHPYVVGRCAIATAEQVDGAVDAAAAATGEWAAVPLESRLDVGRRFRARLVERWDELIDLLVAEAHPRRLAEWELDCLLKVYDSDSCAWYARQLHASFDCVTHSLIVRRRPDGVVCLNPPQNAPAASAALAVLVLMAGNTVVVRAPRSVALSTMFVLRELVVPILEEVGAPPGTLNMLVGNPREVLDRWLDHPGVNDIFYIGDSREGRRIQGECVANGKKPILELSGNDGVVVWNDADLDLASDSAAECFLGSGQICMVPKYVVAHPDIADELIRLVLMKTELIRPGYPDDDTVLLSPVRRSERFFEQLRQAVEGGAELLTGGRRLEPDGTPSETGVFLEPTVLRVRGLEGAREFSVVRDETFYPLLPIVVPDAPPASSLLDEVVAFVNANDYGLRNSLWTASSSVTDRFVRDVTNGGLLKINDSHTGFLPIIPSHGGTGLTGGVFGEANYPILRTTHLQGLSMSRGARPRDSVVGRLAADLRQFTS